MKKLFLGFLFMLLCFQQAFATPKVYRLKSVDGEMKRVPTKPRVLFGYGYMTFPAQNKNAVL